MAKSILNIDAETGRTIVIGDIHGCISELSELIDMLKIQYNDKIIFIGDLINKGPFSNDVISFVYKLSMRFNVVYIKGNHEDKFLRWIKHKQNGNESVIKMTNNEDFEILYDRMTEDEIEFVNKSILYYKLAENNILIVHAGIPLVLTNIGDDPNIIDSLNPKDRQLYYKVLRIRYETNDGLIVKLNEQTSMDIFWADRYNGRFGNVIFGHHAFINFENPQIFPYAIGIDLGCVYGGYLCALVLYKKKIDNVIVKAKSNYYQFMETDEN